jgi:fatty-acyl-CoA synthase
VTTLDELLRRRAGDAHTALLFEDQRWTWDEHVRASAARAALMNDRRTADPFHVGYLLENVPECSLWLGAGVVSGIPLVGINPTRRGAELAADIRHTDCRMLVTERALLPLLDGIDTGIPREQILVVDTDEYRATLEPFVDAPLPDTAVAPDATAFLIFTSGTTGAPKAARVGQTRLARGGGILCGNHGLDANSVFYMAMPLFHSNALFAGWSPLLNSGGAMALRRRFSASGFIDDVRRYQATYFNYVGKPLSYILATPERPDDADTTLTVVVGNEGNEHDLARFAQRFGVSVTDSYGSTEGGLIIRRSDDQPPGTLGQLPDGARILNSETGEECEPAKFGPAGELLNPAHCIGEIVNTAVSPFEGYYNNDDADRVRTRNGWYWTGDLGYVDADGWCYFAGRDYDWLRVDGENFAAAPIERIIGGFPGVVLGAVYAVPAPDVGDDVMCALQLAPGVEFDPAAFDAFLAQHPDLGTKWSPRYVRVMDELPVTATSKIVKRDLRAEAWNCTDPVWWRPERNTPLTRRRQ